MYACAPHMCLMLKEVRREDTGFPGAGVTCSHEPPDMGSGNQNQSFPLLASGHEVGRSSLSSAASLPTHCRQLPGGRANGEEE